MMASARAEEKAFKILAYITKKDDSSPVFFKADGERFKDTRTLKLQIDTVYKVVLEIRPPMQLRWDFRPFFLSCDIVSCGFTILLKGSTITCL